MKYISLITLAFFFFIFTVSADDRVIYDIKGVVVGLPGNGRAPNEILIKHEPIPGYKDISGKVVGMEAMTMPFYLAPGVKLDGISTGDKVAFKLETTWKPSFTDKVTEIKRVE